MKTKPIMLTVFVLLVAMGTALAAGATNDVSSLLQKGLFEEEANHNLEAAITAYQAVVTQTEKDRQFAATAIFRLGECYRKLGRTNEATVQYQRILREFPDQTELAKLSQNYVGTAPSTPSSMIQMQAQGFPQPVDAQAQREAEELDHIKNMIKDSPDLINGSPNDFSPLYRAAEMNYTSVARFLLENGANVNLKSRGGGGAITIAAQNGHKEMVELLANHGADVNEVQTMNDSAPLHFAAKEGAKALAQVLLAHKANANVKNSRGETPLHIAAENGFLSFAELLLTNGASVSAQNDQGETPLHYAARADNRNIMELLISHGADVNARARNDETPLLAAAGASKLGAVRLLLTYHADVNPKRTDGRLAGWMPLHYAVAYGQLDLAKLLLDHNAEVDAPVSQYSLGGPFGGGGGGGGLSPSPGGFGGSRPGPGGFGGGRMGSSAYFNISPLAMAVITGNKDMAELLLDHKPRPNDVDKNSDTPLSLAVKLGHLDLAELLLSRGASVDVKNNDQLSPLGIAVNNNAPEMVKLLLAHKPGLEVTDNDFLTPLQRAVINGQVEVMGLLLDAGANPDVAAERSRGQCPLQWAVLRDQPQIVKLLVEHRANPNFQDTDGNTPLSQARQQLAKGSDAATTQNRKDIVELLLKAGANDNLQRLTGVSVTRNGMGQDIQVFYKGTNSFNHPTLYETLAAHYSPPSYNPRNMGGGNAYPQPFNDVCGLRFPNFGKIKISRLQKDGRTNTLNVDFESALNTGDCSKDIPLEWGDVVEIPESIHNVNETWTGLTDAVAGTLKKCLERKVSIVVRGATNQLILRPNHYVLQKRFISESGLTFERNPFTAMPEPSFNGGRGVPSTDTSLKTQLPSFWLYDVVHGANVILTSSDLTHVRVKRVNTTTHRAEQMTFDLTKKDLNNQLLLRDGDVVELPDKL